VEITNEDNLENALQLNDDDSSEIIETIEIN
jgi:hypothetical protein